MSPEPDNINKSDNSSDLHIINSDEAKVDPRIAGAVRRIATLLTALSTGLPVVGTNDDEGNVRIDVVQQPPPGPRRKTSTP